MSRVRTGKFNAGIEILRHQTFTAIPVMLDGTLTVDDESVVLEEGRKIVKAGTILGGKSGTIFKGGKVATLTEGDDPVAEGVLRYDVDVTEGDRECSMIIRGEVYEDKLPVTLTEEVREALATRILFIK